MRRAAFLTLVLFASAAACGNSSGDSTFDGGASSSSSGSSGVIVTGKPDGSDVGPDGCAEAAKLVYVVSAQNDLYSFRPNTLAFTKIGRLDCPAGSATPNSMAVDRSGTAWVNYNDGTLFKVSTTDASCTATTFQAGQSGFYRFGMAFSSNSAGSTDETLFVSGLNAVNPPTGLGLGKIDLSTMKLTAIADYPAPLTQQAAEFTGTGDARLFGFFTTNPATLAQVDKTTAVNSNDKTLTGLDNFLAFAFSFWGGDFWFYTATTVSTPSKVTRLRTSSDSSLSTVVPDVGFTIVGAGVSTCAPTSPVN
jgi:hypothetical protein